MIHEKSNIVPSEFIIVGGTGNLSKNKILPALFWRFLDNQIDTQSNVILCDKQIKSYKDFFLELKSKLSIFFLRSPVFNKSLTKENSGSEISFFRGFILNFSPTNRTRFPIIFFKPLFL